MPDPERIRLVVLFGGQSAEHEVSCISAYHVLRAVDPERYELDAVGITRQVGELAGLGAHHGHLFPAMIGHLRADEIEHRIRRGVDAVGQPADPAVALAQDDGAVGIQRIALGQRDAGNLRRRTTGPAAPGIRRAAANVHGITAG